MRTTAQIRKDIIEESKNYQIVADVAWVTMPDVDTDAPGSEETIASIREHLYALYEEMLVAYKEEKAAN